MPIEGWFPTPIFYEHVEGAAALIEDMLPHLRRFAEGRRTMQPLVTGPAYSGSNDDTRAQYLFMEPELKPLYAMINARAVAFAEAIGVDGNRENLYLGRSWVNILQEGGTIEPHHHAASIFSGAFYLKVPEPGTVLRFRDPKEPLRKDPFQRISTPFNTGHVDYPVQEGMLLLFPGYLTHGMIAPNHGPGERITLSFDYYSVSLAGQSAPPPPRHLVDRLWKKLEES